MEIEGMRDYENGWPIQRYIRAYLESGNLRRRREVDLEDTPTAAKPLVRPRRQRSQAFVSVPVGHPVRMNRKAKEPKPGVRVRPAPGPAASQVTVVSGPDGPERMFRSPS